MGYAAARIETRSVTRVAVVDALVVRADLRDHGYGGKAMTTALLARASANGAEAMAAVPRGNAYGFWSRQGFAPSDGLRWRPGGTVMTRPPPPRPPRPLTHPPPGRDGHSAATAQVRRLS